MSFYQISEIEAREFDSTNNAQKVTVGDAGVFRISSVQTDAANSRVSAIQGDAGNLQVSAKSNDGALLRVSSIVPFTFSNITTSAQTVVKSGAGVLHGIAVNAQNISAMAAYDNTVSGGTTIFTLGASAQTGGPFYTFDLNFATGLVISTGSSNSNITVVYK